MKPIDIKKKNKLYGNDFLRINDEDQCINDWIRNDPKTLIKTLRERRINLEYKCYKKLLGKIV